MKKLISIASATLISLACFGQGSVTNVPQPIVNSSQVPGIYPTPFNGATNQLIAGLSTNAYTKSVTNVGADGFTNVINFPTNVVACSDHPNLGLTITYGQNAAASATNGIVTFSLSRSFDNGNTFETTPFRILTNTPPTAANGYTNTYLFDIQVTNATHIAIVQSANTGAVASASVSNVLATWNLGQPRTYTEAARR
jgi:hypothetical protein